jgi:hypothetical protein
MAKEYNDRKIGLGEPYASMLKDFCAASYKAAALDVIREAIRIHIEGRLANEPVMRQRYEEARRKRLSLPDKIARLVPKDGGG